jgi:hypothetical protein
VKSRSTLANGRGAWISYAPKNALVGTAYRKGKRKRYPKYVVWMLQRIAGE